MQFQEDFNRKERKERSAASRNQISLFPRGAQRRGERGVKIPRNSAVRTACSAERKGKIMAGK
jgi:hypothetical protein